MRFLIALFSLIPLQAMSLKDFNAQPPADQSAYVANFIDKMASDLGAKNPQLAAGIRDYFSRPQEGRSIAERIPAARFVELPGAFVRLFGDQCDDGVDAAVYRFDLFEVRVQDFAGRQFL